jgi:sugar/nucleoside kinase (ribokinase family)
MDVVGVGALNVDLIAGASALQGTRVLDLISRKAGISPPLEPCTERLVDESTVRTALACLDSPGAGTGTGIGTELTAVLGGSAFNTLHALARTGLGLSLGYVSVAGRTPVPGVEPEAVLDGLGIDRRMVRADHDSLSGICLSVYEDGERTLLTHTGANTGIADHVRDRFEELASYIGAARVAHVTSFLDPDGGRELYRLLAEVRRRSPGTRISFDPGHAWSTDPSPAVLAVAALSDYLLLNGREYADFMPLVPGGDATAVVKYPGRVEVRGPGAAGPQVYAHEPLPDDEVEDATGAGDVFAAGLLAAIGADRGIGEGVRLGMALARHKLRHIGAEGHGRFAEITREQRARGDGQHTVPPYGI